LLKYLTNYNNHNLKIEKRILRFSFMRGGITISKEKSGIVIYVNTLFEGSKNKSVTLLLGFKLIVCD